MALHHYTRLHYSYTHTQLKVAMVKVKLKHGNVWMPGVPVLNRHVISIPPTSLVY